jgi:predicted ATPase/class 3 adenylate cyclase
MTSESVSATRQQLEAAIAAQEGLRATLGDSVVDATIGVLRAQLSRLAEVEQQRKLATVLFMDVVGSTNLMRGRDPEETMAIMDSALSALAVPVGEHGGRVTRFMGDGFMAVFGLPTAQENDPEMAIRAGLAIIGVAKKRAADLEEREGVAGFAVRVGVNTGLVVTGGQTEAEDTIMGDSVNLAARLESAAPAGTVLISRDTYQHVRGLFEVEDGGTIEAKGFPHPVVVYRVTRRAAAEARSRERGIEGLEIPMIGRDGELEITLDSLQATVASGRLHVVTIIGEAGLGKSRLLQETRRRLRAISHTRLEARAVLERRDSPHGVIRDLIERRFGIRGDDDAATARTKLVSGTERALGGGSEAEQKAHFIGQLIGYDFGDSPHVRPSLDSPQQIRSRAVMYLTEVIGALASANPVVMLIEDLHWADAGSLDLLGDVMVGLADSPVLLVGAARPSLRAKRPSWGEGDRHRWIRLEPLTDAQSEQLAATALRKVIDCPGSLRRRLVEHAGGNPYYLEETIRMLVDDGVIVPGDEIWTIDGARFPEMRIPATLSGVIQARLDGLSRAERTAVQQASVVGRVFWDATIEYLARDTPDLDNVEGALEALSDREMVHLRAESGFSDASEYLFHHEILRAVAYEGVLRRIRRSYHASVADWLIANSGDRAAELAPLIAGHLENAGRDAEALHYYSEAAEAALAGYAVETADEFFERALSLAPTDDVERRFALVLGRSRTLAMQGRRDQQALLLDELAVLAGDDPSAMATAATERTWLHWFSSEFPAAVSTAYSAVEAASASGDLGLEAKARHALAMALTANEDFEIARPEAEHALRLAEAVDDLYAVARAHNALGLIALASRDHTAAREHLAVSLEVSRRLGDLERELTAANNLGIVETLVGNYRAARSYFDRFRQIAADVGDRLAEASSVLNLAWVAASEEDWSLARSLAEKSIAQKRNFGQLDAVAEGLMWLGHALFGLGDAEAARDAYSEALQIREELDQTGLAMGARAGLARMALAAGEIDTALAHAAVICSHLDEGGTLAGAWEPLRIHLSCAQVLRTAGDPAGNRVLARARKVLLADADRIADPVDRQTFLANVPWHREILELTGGEPRP